MYCRFAKWRHTIMLIRHCEAWQYATYGFRIHRRHINRLPAVLRAGLCATIFTKCGCHRLVIVQQRLAYHVSQLLIIPNLYSKKNYKHVLIPTRYGGKGSCIPISSNMDTAKGAKTGNIALVNSKNEHDGSIIG